MKWTLFVIVVVSAIIIDTSRSVQIACKYPVTVVVQLNEGVDPFIFGERNKIQYREQVGELERMYEYVVGCAQSDMPSEYNAAVTLHQQQWMSKLESKDVISIEFQRKATMHPKSITLPWSLQDNANVNRSPAYIEGAWKLGFNGSGVLVMIVDDGADFMHSDIRPNFLRNYAGNFGSAGWISTDSRPSLGDGHGSACLSIAAARGRATNTPCVVGVAIGAYSSGVRAIAEPVSGADLARALTLNLRNVGVTSCSFGIIDDGVTIGGPSNAEKTAIASALTAGRGGKGSLYFWASGNGRDVGDTCDYDGYLQQGNAIGIGALTDAGDVAWYSEACAALMFVAPSNGGRQGVTAARANSLLSTCRNDFGGTSAATPFAAGVYAIIVSANPKLTAREVLEIMVVTATKIKPQDPSWITNKAGYKWSKTYGFGEMNATKAAIMAHAARPNSKPQIHTSAPFVGCSTVSLGSGQISQTVGLAEQRVLPCAIPDNSHFGVAMWNFVSKYRGADLIVEDVFVQFTVTHRVRRELEFALVSPSNTRIVVRGRPYDSGSDYDWEIKFVGFRGENATGRWLFGVKDTLPGTAGSINTAAITLHGH